MPGLRSLVARRRASLNTTPPCSPHSPHSTNDTPSPSPTSLPPADNAVDTLNPHQGQTEDQCLMPGSGSESAGGDEGLEKEPVDCDRETQAINKDVEGESMQGGGPKQEDLNAENLNEEEIPVDQPIKNVEGESMQGEAPRQEDYSAENIDGALKLRESETSEIPEENKKSFERINETDKTVSDNTIDKDNIDQNVDGNNTSTIPWKSDNITGEKPEITDNTENTGNNQQSNSDKILYSENPSELNEISLIDKLRKCSENIGARVLNNENPGSVNQESWSSDFLSVVESRRSSNTSEQNVNERETAQNRDGTGGCAGENKSERDTVQFPNNDCSLAGNKGEFDNGSARENVEFSNNDRSLPECKEETGGSTRENINERNTVQFSNNDGSLPEFKAEFEGTGSVKKNFSDGGTVQFSNNDGSARENIYEKGDTETTEGNTNTGNTNLNEYRESTEGSICEDKNAVNIPQDRVEGGVETDEKDEQGMERTQGPNQYSQEAEERMEWKHGLEDYRETNESSSSQIPTCTVNMENEMKGNLKNSENVEEMEYEEEYKDTTGTHCFDGRQISENKENDERNWEENELSEAGKSVLYEETQGDEYMDYRNQEGGSDYNYRPFNYASEETGEYIEEASEVNRNMPNQDVTDPSVEYRGDKYDENTGNELGKEESLDRIPVTVHEKEIYQGDDGAVRPDNSLGITGNPSEEPTYEAEDPYRSQIDPLSSQTLEGVAAGGVEMPLKTSDDFSNPIGYEDLKQDEASEKLWDESKEDFSINDFDEQGIPGQLTGDEDYDDLFDFKEGELSDLDDLDEFDKEEMKAEGEDQPKVDGELSEATNNEGEKKKDEGLKDDELTGNNKRPYPFTVSPKVKKGPGRCSELSATEIESTLASRGVTIVRRMVDSKENARGNPDNKTDAGKTGVVVTPNLRNTRQSARLLSLYKTQGRPNLKDVPIAGQGSSVITKDLYKSINARGTLIHPGSKTPQNISGAKGMQFNTRGVSIQFNPKGSSSLSVAGGTTIYSKTRPPNIYTKGNNMQMNPKGVNVNNPRMFTGNTRARGPAPQSLRGANLQGNPRGVGNMGNARGMMRPMRYSTPRGGLRPSLAGMNLQPRSSNPRMRGVNPQSFKGNQMQNTFNPQSKMGPANKPLHSTNTDSRAMKVSPNPQSSTQFKPGELAKPGTGNMQSNIPAQSNIAGMSPQQQRSDGMLSPPNRPAEMSPPSRPMSSQSVGSGYAQGNPQKFTGLSPGPENMGTTQIMEQKLTNQSGIVQPRPGISGHMSVPSSQHLMMDYGSVGIPPHSSPSARLLPPHSVPGMIPQASTPLTGPPQLGLSPGLSPLPTSESYTSATEGFPTLSHSEFLGRSSTETFPYNPGFPPHSSTTTDFSSTLSTGDFNMQPGFTAQSNLGFSAQTNPCAYPHVSSGFANSGLGHTLDNFGVHPQGFSPIVNAPYPHPPHPPHSTAQLYSTPGNDILGYSSRDFMMGSSREFYSGTNQLNPGLSLHNPGLSMPSNTAIGDQYSQTYADPNHPMVAHSSYQQDPLQTRSNPTEIPLLPDLRNSNVYGNYRDPVAQGYRDIPLNSLSSVQSDRSQNLQGSYKQPVSTYRDQDIIANYLESSVLYRDSGEMQCPETTYRPSSSHASHASSHTSPEQQVLPSFSNPASHASPQEQVISNYNESASPRDQVISQQPGENVLPGFRESLSNNSAHQELPGFRDSMTYPGCRESGNYNVGYEKPGSNTSDYASSTSSRHSDVARSNTYKDPHSVSGFGMTEPSVNDTVLPSFTESFDSTSPDTRKDGTLSHYKPMSSEYGSLKGSPASVSTESTCATSPFVNHHTGDMSPLTNEYHYARENYQNKRMYTQAHDPFSPAQYSDEGGGNGPGQHSSNAAYPGTKDSQFFHDSSATVTEPTYCGPKNSIAKSDAMGLSQPVVSDSSQYCGATKGLSGTRNIPGRSDESDQVPKDVKCNHLYQGDKGPLDNDKTSAALGFRNGIRRGSGSQTPEGENGINYRPFLGRGEAPHSPKFPSVSSPTKSDSASPGTQERIVIKMKLLHANSTINDEVPEENVKDIGTGNNKSSVKYTMAKYTRWTIDSIINGSEESSDAMLKEEEKINTEKDENCDKYVRKGGNKMSIEKEESEKYIRKGSNKINIEKDENCDKYARKGSNKINTEKDENDKYIRKASKLKTSEKIFEKAPEIFGEIKDTGLDTNKNLMKKSIKITITNPLRARISPDENCEVKKEEKVEVKEELKPQEDLKPLPIVEEMEKVEKMNKDRNSKDKNKDIANSLLSISRRGPTRLKTRRAKSPSPTANLESMDSLLSISQRGTARGDCLTKRLKNRRTKSPSPSPSLESTDSLISITRRGTTRGDYLTKRLKNRHAKSPSPTPSLESTDSPISITRRGTARGDYLTKRLKNRRTKSPSPSPSLESTDSLISITRRGTTRGDYLTKRLKNRHAKSPSPSPSLESTDSLISITRRGTVRGDCLSKRLKNRHAKSPSPTPSLESCSSSSTTSSDQEQGDLKKCSIVIKRIYTENNYSCYSSSLCEENTHEETKEVIKRRPKRRAAVEASVRFHKTLRPLDCNTPKARKLPCEKGKETTKETETTKENTKETTGTKENTKEITGTKENNKETTGTKENTKEIRENTKEITGTKENNKETTSTKENTKEITGIKENTKEITGTKENTKEITGTKVNTKEITSSKENSKENRKGKINNSECKMLCENTVAVPSQNIAQCSVLLYDVFMDSRLNKLSCPGCSRHYDSTDGIQVNISKATISLLCSVCHWFVVKDVKPHEIISSLAPS